jgi:hypothetical protein
MPYILVMKTTARPVQYSGTLVRIESDGFGIIQFDEPIGPSANTFGVISNSTATVVHSGTILRPGVHVHGTAEADERDIAAVKTVTVSGP